MTEDVERDKEEAESTQPKSKRRKQVGRSPAYPAIDLARAIERARVIWEIERQHLISPQTAMKRWNYTSMNGPAGLQLSALVKFGLMDDQGTKSERRVRLTDLCIRIMNHPEEEERQKAIRVAALNPPVHREMWNEYGTDLPSDDTLMWNLTRERGFTESGAREFIKEYKATIAFARMDEALDEELELDFAVDQPFEDMPPKSAVMSAPTASVSAAAHAPLVGRSVDDLQRAGRDYVARLDAQGRRIEARRLTQQPAVPRFPIPLPGNRGEVTISGPFPLSESEWTYFLAVLQVMKPGFVQEDDPRTASPVGGEVS